VGWGGIAVLLNRGGGKEGKARGFQFLRKVFSQKKKAVGENRIFSALWGVSVREEGKRGFPPKGRDSLGRPAGCL